MRLVRLKPQERGPDFPVKVQQKFTKWTTLGHKISKRENLLSSLRAGGTMIRPCVEAIKVS